MAIFQAGSRPGTFTGTKENLFLEMKNLRGALLNVGLNELIVPNGFNATESGDVSQIPTARNTYSNFMWFAFSDPLQDVAPVYIGFRAGFGDYFNYYTSGGIQRFFIQSCVTREMGADGVPVTSTGYYSRGAYGGAYSDSGYTVNRTNSLGDFVRYTGDTLMLCFLVNSGSGVMSKSGSFLLISRVGKAIQIVQDDRYYSNSGSNSVSIRQMKLPSGNTLTGTPSVARRAGDFLLDGNNVPIVAPIYAYDENNQIQKLSKIFSFPTGILSNGQIVRLDFSGVEKPYLYLEENNFAPTGSCAWLMEWE